MAGNTTYFRQLISRARELRAVEVVAADFAFFGSNGKLYLRIKVPILPPARRNCRPGTVLPISKQIYTLTSWGGATIGAMVRPGRRWREMDAATIAPFTPYHGQLTQQMK